MIAGPGSGSVFGFQVSGAQLALSPDGGVSLLGPLADYLAVPPPTVVTADETDATAASLVRYELLAADRLLVRVDEAWLDGLPESAFPVVIDPSWLLVEPTGRRVYSSPSGGTLPPFGYARTGRDSAGRIWRSAVRFDQWAPYVGQDYRLQSARVIFSAQQSGSRSVTLYDEGQAGPSSFATIGDTAPLETKTITYPDYLTGVFDVTDLFRAAFDGGGTGRWLGVRGVETAGTNSMDFAPYFEVYLLETPPESHVTNVANNQVLATTTPTLQALPVSTSESQEIGYDFQITTNPAPGSGMVLSSGLHADTSWQVPTGSLTEGVTYWAWVLTDYRVTAPDHPLPTIPSPAAGRKFTVDMGLGEGGPSPTDEVGSVPGQASSPSEGAPGPGLPGSKVTVNLVNGNLSMTLGTRTMATLSGPLALGFTYNSLGVDDRGLRAEFYNDTNTSGAIDSGDTLVGRRVDPSVAFDWGGFAKPVAAQDPAQALARWSGFVTLPFSGNVQVGAISSDGLRVSVGGTQRLDRWASHEPEAMPVFGPSFAVTSGTTLPITVEWRNTTGAGVARVFVREAAFPEAVYALSPSWLTYSPSQLPAGWTLNAAAGTGRWVGLSDIGTSVSLYSADGSAHEFTAAGNGSYTAPITAPNDLLSAVTGGGFVLEDAGGSTYSFRADGVLESIVTATDDRNPAGLVYGYTGTPARLTTITDPVSQRAVTLSYGGDTACGSVPAAASGLLCRVGFWDGTATTLTYNTSGRFVRLTNPGNIVHDFAYDSAGRLTHVRDPLAYDAIAAGVRSADGTDLTAIAYYADGKVFAIGSPLPTVGAAPPGRIYGYDPVARTGSVYVLGFNPTVGYAQQVTYDSRNRITKTTGADGLASTYAWDVLDRLIATTDTAGIKTTTVYDHASRPIATYGPAPASSFQSNGLPAPGTTVPTTTRTFDAGIDALGAAYWANPDHAGGPDLHDTGIGGTGNLDKDWGVTPPVAPGPQGWSARFDGFVRVATAGQYSFRVETKGTARVWVGSHLAADYDGTEAPSGWSTATGDPINLAAGMHRIRVDMADTTGPSGLRVLRQAAGGGGFAVISGSDLEPNYGLVTSETDPDGKVTATEYADSATGIGPHHGLATASIVDPAGLDLRTTATYEAPGPSGYLRRVARTLPAGNSWTTDSYTGTEGPIAAVCGVGAAIPQGGLPKRLAGPDPDGAGPELARVEEFVYDAIGRRVGRRHGNTSTITAAGWQCSTYDSRGRPATESWPTHASAPSRTVTYTYAVGGSPLVNRVTDNTWGGASISATVDLLGRTTSYTDIFGNTTTTAFDQAGRVTVTDNVFPIEQTYNAANGRAGKVVVNGIDTATPSYDSFGRLAAVEYFNGTFTTHSYDTNGRNAGIGVFDQTGVTGDLVTRSLAGRVVDQLVGTPTGFVDPAPAGANFVYDGAGRLTQATMRGAAYTYSYAASAGCASPDAGRNTNRTSVAVTGAGAGTTSSCFDGADRLVSTSSIAPTAIAYDDHGNTTRLGGERLEFDSADRHVATATPTHVVRHRRDPLDRIVQRTDTPRVAHVATASGTGAASVSVARPPGTQAGDLLVAAVTANGVLPGSISASGWTSAAQQLNGTGRTAILWRYATGSDPGSWSFSSSLALNMSAGITTYRATAGTAPIITTATGTSLAATSHPLPAVTTNSDAAQVISAIGFAGNVSATAPSESTVRVDLANNASLMVVDRSQDNPGSSGSPAVTTSKVALSSASVTVAIKAVSTTSRYGHAGHSDTSQFTTNTTGALTGWTIPLPGNVIYTYSSFAGYTFTYFNMHGDALAITDANGNRLWEGRSGPYGETIAATPDNTNVAGSTLGWHGKDQRLTDRGGLVHMGARPYSPAHGRFLTVDPIEGGCANDYTYVSGDPVNQSDISGLKCPGPLSTAAQVLGFGPYVRAIYVLANGGSIGDAFGEIVGNPGRTAKLTNGFAWRQLAKATGNALAHAIGTGLKATFWPVSVGATAIDGLCVGLGTSRSRVELAPGSFYSDGPYV